MKFAGFHYKVLATVFLEKEDLEVLVELSDRHYDAACRALSQQGGFLYGLTNVLSTSDETDPFNKYPVELDFQKIDFLLKICEQWQFATDPPAAMKLRVKLDAIITDLSNERTRIHSENPAKGDPMTKPPSTLPHQMKDNEECNGWCQACAQNMARGYNPDGTVPELFEVDVEGQIDEARGIRYIGKATRQASGGKWLVMADVAGALCRVECVIRVKHGKGVVFDGVVKEL